MTRHGFAWQDIAYDLEVAAWDPSFLNLPVDLGRYASFEREMNLAKEQIPRNLSRWGLMSRKKFWAMLEK